MSQSSRAARRHGSGATPPPKKNDPMRIIYIALGVIVVLIFAGFGYFRHQQDADAADAVATPTPLPSSIPTSKPVNVDPLKTLGKSVFDKGNMAAGGHGDPVDGIPCGTMEQGVLHIHTHLSIFDHGKQVALPQFIGIVPQGQSGCLYWLHTHDATGVIHIEAAAIHNPKTGGYFTLGNFFDIWGQPLSRTQVATLKGPVTAFVNGAKYDGDLKDIPLRSRETIVLDIGDPVQIPPPNYVLPAGD